VRRKLILTSCWGLTVSYWAFIAVITHIPQSGLPGVPVSDKTSHLVGYGVLASMLYVTLWIARPGDWSTTWKVPLILFAYGALDEATQPMFRRSGEFADWVADCAGALIAVGLWSCIRLAAARIAQKGQEPHVSPCS
jgi:VanZ family protein